MVHCLHSKVSLLPEVRESDFTVSVLSVPCAMAGVENPLHSLYHFYLEFSIYWNENFTDEFWWTLLRLNLCACLLQIFVLLWYLLQIFPLCYLCYNYGHSYINMLYFNIHSLFDFFYHITLGKFHFLLKRFYTF